jgi:4,5-dihydroxyphthalate decarboxylase
MFAAPESTMVALTLACGEYDRTMALALGDVRPESIELTYLRMHPEEVFWRMNRHQEFDAAEMSMSSYLIRRSRGDDAMIGIPVFTSRFFRHACIFVNAQAGIEQPADLKGKRMGVPEYQMTAPVWIRGILEDDYGVRPNDMRWLQGGMFQTGRVEKLAIEVPGLEISPIGPQQTLSQMIADGEIDALMAARTPSTYDGAGVRRLFPDYRKVEAEYFRRTGIFPIMHTVVIRKDVLERWPWVARSLYDAFCEAKARNMANLDTSLAALPISLPWVLAEADETRALMGDDFWPYGLEANRKTLETLARYSHSQRLARRLVPIEELFAPSTLDEYRI